MNDYKMSYHDLKPYLPLDKNEIEIKNRSSLFRLLYKMDTQEAYYYATEHTNFKARPYSHGTYSKYNSIDDKIDDLHYYTTFIKFV